MGFFADALTWPVLGAPRLTHWLAEKLAQEAARHSLEEGSPQGQLLELQQRLDLGQIDEREYDRQEGALLARLNALREAQEGQGQQG